jgi:hypothetical protein
MIFGNGRRGGMTHKNVLADDALVIVSQLDVGVLEFMDINLVDVLKRKLIGVS